MPLPTLILPPELTATKTMRFDTKEVQLGDGYTQVAAVGVTNGVEEWSVTSDWLFKADADAIVNQLIVLRGATPFAWTPNGANVGKVYTCEQFEVEQQPLLRRIKATFVEFLQGECEPYRTEHLAEDELLIILENAKQFLLRFTRDTKPFMINSAYLLNNSFHDVLGRSGYFTYQSATTEGQFVAVRAAMYAFQQTGDEYWRSLAIAMANAAIFYLYPNKPFPPVSWNVLDPDNISVAHWLCNLEAVPSKAPAAPDQLNNGYFNYVLNFVNGYGQIPAGAPTFGDRLANVYRVIPMNEELLWNNVYAYPRYNPDNYYRIDYWVSDIALRGGIYRIYGTSDQPNGQQPTATVEPVGTIKLVVPYTGQLKVTFMYYDPGRIIGANTLYDPYPAWRLLDDGEALAAIDTLSWGYEAFKFLWESTGNEFWYRCMYYTLLTEIFAADIKNSSAWYKKLTSPDPFRHPGSQVIVAPENDTRTFLATRNIGGDKDKWLRLDVTASNQQFPSIEIQNFAVQPAVNEGTIVQVEAACSQATILEVTLSLSQNAFDFTKYYIARMPVVGGNVPVIRNFNPKEFIKWNTGTNVWNPFIAEQPIYSYSGLGAELTVTLESVAINGVLRDVYKADMWAKGGFAGIGFVTRGIAPDLGGAAPKLPFTIFAKLDEINDYGCQLKVTINGDDYYSDITQGFDWAGKTIEANDLVLQGEPDAHPPSDGTITNIELQAIGVQRIVIWLWWIGSAPDIFPGYAQTYKAAVVSKIKTAHTLWCGNFEAVGAPTTQLRYTPGINMFTMNIKKKGLESWRGAVPMSGYQDVYHLVLTEQWGRLPNMLQFLEDAQAEYTRQNTSKLVGPFMPAYILPFWDASDYVDNRGYNVWTIQTIDPNYFWIGYTVRPAESVAHAWYLLQQKGMGGTREAKQCERITMKYLGWLFSFFRFRNSYQPPTDITVNPDPVATYMEPHASGFILRTAIYANLCRGNPLITYSIIKGSYDFLKSQIVPTGPMAGSFFQGQPDYIVGGQTLKEGFGFWFFEIIQAIALLHQHREELRLPSCNAPLG